MLQLKCVSRDRACKGIYLNKTKGRFPLGVIFRAERHFQLENPALNFNLISTSILPKTKTVRKRRNKMSAAEERLAFKKLLVLIALFQKTYSKAIAKVQGNILGQTDVLTNRIIKDNF